MSHDLSNPPIPGRLPPEAVAALFRKHGVVPRFGAYLYWAWSGDVVAPCGCAVGVRLVEACGGFEAAVAAKHAHGSTTQTMAALTGAPRPYVDGLDYGFTIGDLSSTPTAWRSIPEFLAGFADGAEVRRLVLPPVEPKGASR